MEYPVTMTTHVPDGTSEEVVADAGASETAHIHELAAQGHTRAILESLHPNDPAVSESRPAATRARR